MSVDSAGPENCTRAAGTFYPIVGNLGFLRRDGRFAAESVAPLWDDGSMAAVLDFEAATTPTREQADAAFGVVISYLSTLPARTGVPIINRYRTSFDAAEARLLALVVGDDGNTKAAENIAGKGGKSSRRTRKRVAKRAAAVKKNDKLADKMDAGELSGEQVDVLADAQDRTGGASITNDELIDDVGAVNPDLGKSVIDDFLTKNGTADQAQSRHDEQRAKRRVTRFKTKEECEAILIAGDKATIDRIWNQTTRAANALFQSDGGYDVPLEHHPRSHDQRMFDAITGALTTGPMGTDATDTCAAPADAEAPSANRRPNTAGSRRHTPKVTSVRPTVVIAVTLEKFQGLDPTQAAEMIGTGPIADSVLAEYLNADPNIVGMVFGAAGQPLWLGRNVRLASQAQISALIVRDKHCVLCGASHTRCVAHHLLPWHAPARGTTDITNLALVCNTCHRQLHHDRQTLFRDRRSGRWRLRPAAPHEIPPSRPPDPARGQAPLRT